MVTINISPATLHLDVCFLARASFSHRSFRVAMIESIAIRNNFLWISVMVWVMHRSQLYSRDPLVSRLSVEFCVILSLASCK